MRALSFCTRDIAAVARRCGFHHAALLQRMNIFAQFHSRIAAILQGFVAAGRLPAALDLAAFTVEPPRDASHGDLSCNAAMVYAKDAKTAFASPRALADAIVAELAAAPGNGCVMISVGQIGDAAAGK